MEILWLLTKAWNCGVHLYRYVIQLIHSIIRNTSINYYIVLFYKCLSMYNLFMLLYNQKYKLPNSDTSFIQAPRAVALFATQCLWIKFKYISELRLMFCLTAHHITRRLNNGVALVWNYCNIWQHSGPATRHRWRQYMAKYSQSFSQTAYRPVHCDYQSVANRYKMLTACLSYVYVWSHDTWTLRE